MMGKAQKALAKFKMDSEAGKKQAEYDRKVSMAKAKMNVINIQREIDFLQNEINSNNILEKDERFTDGKKPKFLILNQIDQLNMTKKFQEEQIKIIEEENAKAA